MVNLIGRNRRLWTLFAYILTAVCFCANGRADQLEELAQRVGVRILVEATSERAAQDKAKSQLPYSKMSPGARQRASELVARSSQYRRMPCLQYQVDRGMYQYLIAQPDVAISTWRVMGISQLQMTQTADFEFEASSPDGSHGEADVLWRDANQCVFIVKGAYRTPLLPSTIHASALVWLRYRFVEDENGATLVNQQIETFLHFPSGAIDTIARLASSVTNTILDRNVFEVSLYARMMSRAAETEPEWIEQLAERMDGVADQRRIELVQVSRAKNGGRMLPPANPGAQRAARDDTVRSSGEFRVFEQSLSQVNTHVPLVAGEVTHKPSYGMQIGDSNPMMQTPHRYITPEARRAIEEQEARRLNTAFYNRAYANPDAGGVPRSIPPAQVSAATAHATPQTTRPSDVASMLVPLPLASPAYSGSLSGDREPASQAPMDSSAHSSVAISSAATVGLFESQPMISLKDASPGSGPVNVMRPISSRKIVGPTQSSKPLEFGQVPMAASRTVVGAGLDSPPPVPPVLE